MQERMLRCHWSEETAANLKKDCDWLKLSAARASVPKRPLAKTNLFRWR